MKIKIGMNMLLWGVEITSRHIPIFEGIKKAGFDGVEIPVVGQADNEIRAMSLAAKDLGLEVTTVTFITENENPIDPNPIIRKRSVDTLKQYIDQAAVLGSDILCGGIYQAHKYFVGRAATEQEWQWSAEYLQEVGLYAKNCNIKLGLEFLNRFEVFLINTSADARRMCRDVGLDNVGILYDTHHANIEDPAPGLALPSIQKELFHVHLSESHRGTLGTGQVKWQDNFDALKALNYEGWVVIEAFGTSDDSIVNAANIWRNAFESPEQLYCDGIHFIRQHLN